MSMIQIRGLSFSYGAQTVFEDVDLTLDTDWKLGFTGRNGRGKTTFLKILAGRLAAAAKYPRASDSSISPIPRLTARRKNCSERSRPTRSYGQIKRELFALGLGSKTRCTRPLRVCPKGKRQRR